MKNIFIAGNVGKSAETRQTPAGQSVTSWTVAVEERIGQEKVTFWFDCVMWGTRGEKVAPYITKGGKVAVSGDLTRREYEGKTYLGVKVDQVTLMGGGADRSDEPRADARKADPARASDYDDEIPF
jgi:single-strand DNA-binding protein